MQRLPGHREQEREVLSPPALQTLLPPRPPCLRQFAVPAWLSLKLEESCTPAALQLLLFLHFSRVLNPFVFLVG